VGQSIFNHDGHKGHDGLIAKAALYQRQAVVSFVSVVVISKLISASV
jgi:hypothetical protein